MSKIRVVGLDVHADTLAVAVADTEALVHGSCALGERPLLPWPS